MPDKVEAEPLDLLFGGPYMQKSAQGVHRHRKLYHQAEISGLKRGDLFYETAAIHLTLLNITFD